jgi:hypothetical protein
MSWRTVNVVRMRLVLEVLAGGRQAGNAISSAASVIRCHHETVDGRGWILERFPRRAPRLLSVADLSARCGWIPSRGSVHPRPPASLRGTISDAGFIGGRSRRSACLRS